MPHNETSTKSIFFAAFGLGDDEARNRFVSRSCRGRPRTRQRVESLLQAQGRLGRFLSPPLDRTYSWQASFWLGISVGPYQLLEVLGEGGMGVVYRAIRKDFPHEEIALKILRPDAATPLQIARFEAERKVLSRMDHPYVVRALDYGVARKGRPYFTMEWIRGQRVTDFCDEMLLTISERLTLFTKICQGVQHAHARGIVHRDLKPSNILIRWNRGRPEPVIIDFGISSFDTTPGSESPELSCHDQISGTPDYMSPEQMELTGTAVDTRSDVFSLGVVLYELLTGVLPFEKCSDGDLNRFSSSERMTAQWIPPSQRVASLKLQRQDELVRRRSSSLVSLGSDFDERLDALLRKSLQPRPSSRHQSIRELICDIQRYLGPNRASTACST